MSILTKTAVLVLCLLFDTPNIDSKPNELIHKIRMEDDEIIISFINTSETVTFYLFSSYTRDRFKKNKYLLRYEYENEQLKYSFLPLTNYLGTIAHGPIRLTDEGLFSVNQTKYSFLNVEPKSQKEIVINSQTVCDLIKNSSEIVLDFNSNTIVKSDVTYVDIEKVRMDKELVFEFAVFKNLGILETEGADYREKELYIEQAKKYDKLSIKAFTIAELCGL